ncbi:MAG: Smr/MutS family protein [Betaproteobacteria bacterium]|nr:Smr/MutS family protein [Betaproteobacteria bacterium]
MAKDRNASSAAKPFDALKTLQVRRASASPGKPSRNHADTAEIDFKAEMRGVRGLAAPNRAEIIRAKPLPQPRPKAQDEIEQTLPNQKSTPSNPDSFAEAMQDVVRLASDGRIDPALFKKATLFLASADALASSKQTEIASWLDAAPNPNDPSALFRHAIGPAAVLKTKTRIELTRPAPPPQPLQRKADNEEVLRESVETPLSFQDRLDIGDEAVFLRPGLPRRVLTDLRRGRWIVQAELDLHGLTRDKARNSLSQFLSLRLVRGERCVRIIHGKGNGSPGRVGVLKQLSRNWLTQREEILAFCQARPHDGGDGAVLVLLRAPRP